MMLGPGDRMGGKIRYGIAHIWSEDSELFPQMADLPLLK